jgi:hypothetical protein
MVPADDVDFDAMASAFAPAPAAALSSLAASRRVTRNQSMRSMRSQAGGHLSAQLQEQAAARAKARTAQLMELQANGRLGTFVTLNMDKLELKLLEEQQKVMEVEQEQLLAQVCVVLLGPCVVAIVQTLACMAQPLKRNQ